MFYELGPYRFREGSDDDYGAVEINEFAWNAVSNLLFVDQPRSTGFSWVDNDSVDRYADGERSIADDLYEFLLGFLVAYPEFAERDLYIAGESYAGHYIPVFAARILAGNADDAMPTIALQGVAIGNPWISPRRQFESLLPFAEANDLVRDDRTTRDQMAYLSKACADLLTTEGRTQESLLTCRTLERELVHDPMVRSHAFNYYDVRLDCLDGRPQCYDFTKLGKLMEDPETRRQLGVRQRSTPWQTCSEDVKEHLGLDTLLHCDVFLPRLLESGVRVMIYTGVYDMLCNHIGTDAWAHQMQWPGQDAFGSHPWSGWYVDGDLAGRFKQHSGLTLVEVYDAGHMVPMDQPRHALDMISAFIGDGRLRSSLQ